MAKKQDRLGAIAQAAQKVKNSTADAPVELKQKYVMSEGIAAQRGARTGWNPAEAKPAPVTTTYPQRKLKPSYSPASKMTPAMRADAAIDEAVAKRKAVSPKPVQASASAGKKAPAMNPAESFNRMPSSGSPVRPSRAGASYKAGGAADMAYTGVKPAAASRAAVERPKPKASLPRERMPAPHTPAPTPKARGLTGKLVGLGIVANAVQAAYYENKRRKNQNKAK